MEKLIGKVGCIGLLVASLVGLGACSKQPKCNQGIVQKTGTITAVQEDEYSLLPGINYRVDLDNGSRTIFKRYKSAFEDGSDLLYKVGDRVNVPVCKR